MRVCVRVCFSIRPSLCSRYSVIESHTGHGNVVAHTRMYSTLHVVPTACPCALLHTSSALTVAPPREDPYAIIFNCAIIHASLRAVTVVFPPRAGNESPHARCSAHRRQVIISRHYPRAPGGREARVIGVISLRGARNSILMTWYFTASLLVLMTETSRNSL